MNNNYHTHEPLPALKFDQNRNRVKECPCGKSNKDGKFVPYIGFDCKGYCHSCGETFLPELPILNKWRVPVTMQKTKTRNIKIPLVDYIPFSIYQKKLIEGANLYNHNHFIQWLGNENRGCYAFDNSTIQSLIEKYYLGNSGLPKYKGWMLFPYVDIEGRLCDIKAMDYDPSTGKRVKVPFNKIAFIGKEILQNPKANTVRCFYGEHLLNGNLYPVKIFESEATAIYAAAFYPNSICLATGGANGCKWTEKEKCKVLQGRHVTLYPDIDAHDKWVLKANILKEEGINVTVSQLIRQQVLNFANHFGISYLELVAQKFDLRDILKFKQLKIYTKHLPVPVINDPFIALKEWKTGLEFQSVILAHIQTESEQKFTLLFDSFGNAITEPTPAVKAVASFYDLTFSPVILNGELYLCNKGHSKKIKLF